MRHLLRTVTACKVNLLNLSGPFFLKDSLPSISIIISQSKHFFVLLRIYIFSVIVAGFSYPHPPVLYSNLVLIEKPD